MDKKDEIKVAHEFLKLELGIADMESIEEERREILKARNKLNKIESLNLTLKLGSKLKEIEAVERIGNKGISRKTSFLLSGILLMCFSVIGFLSIFFFKYLLVIKIIVFIFSLFWFLSSITAFKRYLSL